MAPEVLAILKGEQAPARVSGMLETNFWRFIITEIK
jgi:hypothetical protein